MGSSQDKENEKLLHVVLGNESCDLDSAVSAFAYALFLSVKSRSAGKDCVDYLPVLNVSRNDLDLRNEVKFIFKKFAVPEKNFICRDEIDLSYWNKLGKLKLTLVDHNILSLRDDELDSSVVEVIDHHKKERQDVEGVQLTIEPVGSCCTLIADKILKEQPEILEDNTLTLLLISTILLDTINLSTTARRATPLDVEVLGKLENFCLEPINRSEIFNELMVAKMDVKSFTIEQLLRKDLKMVSVKDVDIAISSIPLLVKDFLNTQDIVSKLDAFCKVQKINALVIMGVFVFEAEVKRDIVIFSEISKFQSLITEALLSSQDPCLQLVKMSGVPDGVDAFHQNNVIASRKVILPIVKGTMVASTNHAIPECAINSSNNDVNESCPSENAISRAVAMPDCQLDELSPSPTPSPNALRIPVANGLHPSTAAQVSQFLGVGDPFSHGGSSQSSAYNSCPYTPINSYADDGNPLSDMANLPSFNSRDMIEKIETKRGKLRGYDSGDVHDPGSYPYTPVNSFVDCQMDQLYHKHLQQLPHDIDTESIIRRVNEKKVKANLFDFVDENDESVLRQSNCVDCIGVSEADNSCFSQERTGELVQ